MPNPTLADAACYFIVVFITGAISLLWLATLLQPVFRTLSVVVPVLMTIEQRLTTKVVSFKTVLFLIGLALPARLAGGRWPDAYLPLDSDRLWVVNVLASVILVLTFTRAAYEIAGLDAVDDGFPEEQPLKVSRIFLKTQTTLTLFLVTIIAVKTPATAGIHVLLGDAFSEKMRRGSVLVEVVLTANVAIFILTYRLLRSIAILRRGCAPVAIASDQPAELGRPFLLHLSDIHITAGGRSTTEGGSGGNSALAAIVGTLKGPGVPAVVAITGDLVDRGEDDEWVEADKLILSLKEKGMRVLVAPGNHDLSTAYDPGTAMHFLAVAGKKERPVDASRVLSYLRAVSRYEPGLLLPDGGPLAAKIDAEYSEMESIGTLWRQAAITAGEKLGMPPGPQALKRLMRSDPAAAGPLISPVARALAKYLRAEKREDVFRDYLCDAPRCSFDPLLLWLRWRELWHGCFPLRLPPGDDGAEYLIVNSVKPEPGLAASAVGRLGDEQFARLKLMLAASKARSIFVLMHHAVSRWGDEGVHDPINSFDVINRWSMLGHHTGESLKLIETLEDTPPTQCRSVFLMCGHRHGKSRAGRFRKDDGSFTRRLRLLESSSLAEDDSLLLCGRNEQGELEAASLSTQELAARLNSSSPGPN